MISEIAKPKIVTIIQFSITQGKSFVSVIANSLELHICLFACIYVKFHNVWKSEGIFTFLKWGLFRRKKWLRWLIHVNWLKIYRFIIIWLRKWSNFIRDRQLRLDLFQVFASHPTKWTDMRGVLFVSFNLYLDCECVCVCAHSFIVIDAHKF